MTKVASTGGPIRRTVVPMQETDRRFRGNDADTPMAWLGAPSVLSCDLGIA